MQLTRLFMDADSEIAMIWLLVLAVIGVMIWIQYMIAQNFYFIACHKGYDDRKYFHFCFWLGVCGWIMVAALPDRGQHSAAPSSYGNPSVSANAPAANAGSDELPQL